MKIALLFLQIGLIASLYAGEPPNYVDFVNLVMGGTPEEVQSALWAGAKLDSPGAYCPYGEPALIYAVRYNSDPEVTQVLLKAGADVNTRDLFGETALMNAAGANIEVVRLLLEAEAEVNAQDQYGRTALTHAAGKNNSEVVRLLLEVGAEVNAQDRDGWTALMTAARRREYPESIVLLLEAGADAKLKDNAGKTAWDYAQNNEKLKGTAAYEKLREATFE